MLAQKQDAIVIKQAYFVATIFSPATQFRKVVARKSCWMASPPNPQKQKPKTQSRGVVKMDDDLTRFKKINPKSEVKRLRLTVDEKNQLDDFLEKRNLQFSDFNNRLIKNAISAEFHLVEIENYVKPTFPLKQKKHHRPPPKVDPAVLFELGRVGTNLNQCARALNLIKNDRQQELDLTQEFSFIECLQVLQAIQEDIHAVIGEIKKTTMSDTAIENARSRVIKAVELTEVETDAH